MSILKTCIFCPDSSASPRPRMITPTELPFLFHGQSVQKKEAFDTFALIRRTYQDGTEDFRLFAMIDLEDYSFHVGSGHPIRAAEGFSSIEDTASTEQFPLLFLDDDTHSVIEPIAKDAKKYKKIASFRQDTVQVDYFALPSPITERIHQKIDRLSDNDFFKKKYATDSDAPLILAVGRDGTLSAAKREWEKKKQKSLAEDQKDAKERFSLVEVQNLYSPHVSFTPVHRLYQGEHTGALMDFFPRNAPTVFLKEPGQNVTLLCPEGAHTFRIDAALPAVNITAGILSRFVAAYGGRVVPIPGKALLRALSAADGQVGILLPTPKKETFFSGIIRDGILPGDSFIIEEHE